MKDIIITAALTGPVTRKEQNPAVPYTPEEFAAEAKKCYESGAAIVHIHGRDPNTGAPTSNIDYIKNVYNAVSTECPDILINLTSALGLGFSFEERIRPIVEIKPEMATLNTNSMNFSVINRKTGEIIADHVFENTFEMVVDFATKMQKYDIRPELEVYDVGHINNALLMDKQGIFMHPLHFQFVFGVAGGIQFSPENMILMKNQLPGGATWGTCGVGNNSYPAVIQASLLDGHIRVGLEDNVKNLSGNLAKGSWEQVGDAVKIAKLCGREPVDPFRARKMLKIRGYRG